MTDFEPYLEPEVYFPVEITATGIKSTVDITCCPYPLNDENKYWLTERQLVEVIKAYDEEFEPLEPDVLCELPRVVPEEAINRAKEKVRELGVQIV